MPKDTFFNLPEEKRRFILDCAVDEFAEYGFERASTNRIVAAAGIAKGSFYQYFVDKFDVYEYILTSLMADRKLQITKDESPKIDDMPFFDFFRSMLRTIIREFLQKPKLIRISVDFWSMPVMMQNRIYSRYDRDAQNYFIPFIEARVKAGEIAPDVNVRMLGDMLLTMSMSFAQTLMSTPAEEISETMVDELVDKMERILSRGIFAEKRD